MNPMMNFFMNMMMSGGNPEKAIMQLMQSQGGFSSELMNAAQRGDRAAIEQFARQFCKQRGIDFDREFNAFRQNYRL